MHSTVFTLAAVVGLASAWTYPNCDPDNCYNELTDARFYAEAEVFCPEFLASTVTEASAIPTDFSNCGGDVKAVSSACSCITYTVDLTKTPSASSTAPPSTTTTSSSYSTTTESSTIPTITPTSSGYPTYPASSSSVSSAVPTYSASSSSVSSAVPTYSASSSSVTSAVPTYSASSSTSSPIVTYPVTTYPVTTYPVGTASVPMTTSTVYTTSIYTVTSCAPTVTDCPAGPHVTTDIISLYTTVCPVSAASVAPTYPVYGNTTLATSYPVGSGSAAGPKPTASTTAPLTANDAGRVGGSVVVAAAALLAFAL